MELTKVDYQTAHETFEKSGRDLKAAIVMIETGATNERAKYALRKSEGHVFKAIELLRN